MSERPSYLIATIGPDAHLTIFSTHWTAGEAQRMLDSLGRVIGPNHTAYLIVVPEGEGIVDEPQIRLEPKSSNPALRAPDVVSAGPAAPPPTEPPAPFRRRSQSEFEAETIAIMNGEVAMPGTMAFRDVDAPFSEGGAIS